MIDWGICLKKASLMFDGKTIQVNAFATTGSGAFTTISEAVCKVCNSLTNKWKGFKS